MLKKDNLLQILKENKIYLLFLVLSLVLISFMYPGAPGFPSKRFSIILIVFSGFLLLFKNKFSNKYIFVSLALMGGLLSFVTPILDTPDEHVHLSRSFKVSEGQINLDNNRNNLAISEDYFKIFSELKKPINQSNLFKEKHSDTKVKFSQVQENADYRQTNAYWFIAYIPQAIGIRVGQILNLSVGTTYFLGRMMNALVYALLASLAVKYSSKYRQLMMLAVMMPMNLFLAASYNQDAVSLGIIYLIISLFLYFLEEKQIGVKELILYAVLCFVVVTTKLPYIFLVFLLIFIPKERFSSKKIRYASWIVIFLVLIVTVAWFIMYQQIQSPVHREGTSVTEQIKYILTHIPSSIRVIIVEMFSSVRKFEMLFNFGWLDNSMDKAYAGYLLLTVAILVNNFGKTIKGYVSKIGIFLVSLAIVGIVTLSIYLTWTSVGLGLVEGVQGRYYLGVYLLWFILLSLIPEKYSFRTKISDITAFKLLVIAVATMVMFQISTFY